MQYGVLPFPESTAMYMLRSLVPFVNHAADAMALEGKTRKRRLKNAVVFVNFLV